VTNQQVALGMLRKFVLDVDVAFNGREALHALQNLPYDLAFMDVIMPESVPVVTPLPGVFPSWASGSWTGETPAGGDFLCP